MSQVRYSHAVFLSLAVAITSSVVRTLDAQAQSTGATAYDRKQDLTTRRQVTALSSSVTTLKAATASIAKSLGGTVSSTGMVVMPGKLNLGKGDKGDKGERGAQGERGEQGPQGPAGPSGEMPSARYFVPESSCETIDIGELCGEDVGPGCAIYLTLYSTTSPRVIGHQSDVVMQSRTLQGNSGSRYITFFAPTGSSYGEGYVGKAGSTSYFFIPHGVAAFQNHKTYCPSSYVAPAQLGSAINDAYRDAGKLTFRTTSGWNVSMKIVKK